VPEITPVPVEKTSPFGSAESIAQLTAGPPVLSQVSGAMALPTVAETVFIRYAIIGLAGRTVIVTIAVVESVMFRAVTVYPACAETAVGRPEIVPVPASIVNPEGSKGLTE
jgi:hypothetical protein